MRATSTITKSITIVSSRPLKEKLVEVTPDDTAAAILEKAGLDPKDILMKPGDQADFAPTDLPFESIPDGGKLHVVPHSIVGAGPNNLGSRFPLQCALPKTYADELGWRRERTADGVVHTGEFRGATLRYSGWVLQQAGGKLQFFIRKPPIDLIRDTDFAGCFHARNDDWWLIAFKPQAIPADVCSGIVAIQKTLIKAFETRMKKRQAWG